MTRTDKAVIGGGAAGLMAAYTAAAEGKSVTLYEKNRFPGKKLDITGKGRCNLTNNCDVKTFLESVVTNPQFLYSALYAFPPGATMDFFESGGLKLKTERGRRVFPESDRAHDVTEFLTRACSRAGVKFVCADVSGIRITDGAVTGVFAGGKEYECSCAIIATGGLSYPRTGSDGDGYEWARKAGHTVISPRPALVPLVSPDPLCRECMGLSLENVLVTFSSPDGRVLYREQVELMFTHFGLSGPVALSASSVIRGAFPCRVSIDLKPGLDPETLDKRLLRDFSANSNRDFINSLDALLPRKLIEPIVRLSGIDARKKVNAVTREERRELCALLKSLPLTVTAARPISEAIVTSGGVCVREVDPRTMESRLVSGLFFAGEVLDVDALTGGYNLQIAFSTGYVAGKNC